MKASVARLRALHDEYRPFLQLLNQLLTSQGGTAERFARRTYADALCIPVWWTAVPNGVERWLGAARSVAPGLYLRARLVRAKLQDRRRNPKPSDNADEFHVTMAPYVDVMSLDRENLAVINDSVRDVRRMRTASLVRNGDIESLICAIERLPVATVGRG